MKTALLVLASTIASLLLGLWIAAYLTVPGIAMSVEGDPQLKTGDVVQGEPFPICWEKKREMASA